MNSSAVTQKRKELPAVVRELNVILTLTAREMILSVNPPAKIAMAFVWPIMMFGMFGSLLSSNMGINMGFDFNNFMLVGMLVNALFMMTINGVTTLVADRENDFTQEILVSPTSRFTIILGKIVGASFTAYIMYFATILVGLFIGAQLSAAQFWLMLAASPLMCIAAGALGVLIVGFVKSTSAAGMISIMISMIQMFLSGAMIPINHSNIVMSVVSRLLPMTYCVDFARGLTYAGQVRFENTALYPPHIDLIIIAAFTVVFFIIGTLNFVRVEKNK